MKIRNISFTILLTTVVLSVCTLLTQQKATQAYRQQQLIYEHHMESNRKLGRLLISIEKSLNLESNYVMTSDVVFKESFEQDVLKSDYFIEGLEFLSQLKKDPLYEDVARETKSNILELLEKQMEIIRYVDTNQLPLAQREVFNVDHLTIEKNVKNSIRSLMDRISVEQNREKDNQLITLNSATTSQFAALALSIVGFFIALIYYQIKLINPIHDITKKVKYLNHGDKDVIFQGAQKDISEIKQLSDQLEENKRLGQIAEVIKNQIFEITDSLPLGVYQMKIDHAGEEYLFISKGMEDIFHVSIKELMSHAENRNLKIPEEDVKSMKQDVEGAIHFVHENQTAFTINNTFKILHCGKFFIIQHCATIRFEDIAADGSVVFNGYYKDITEQRNERKLMQDVIDAYPYSVQIKDTEGRYLLINKYFCNFLKKKPHQVLGKFYKEIIPGEHIAYHEKAIDHVMNTGQVISQEVDFVVGEKEFSYLLTHFPLLDDYNQIYAIGAISFDMTERKKQELEMKRAKEVAEEAVSIKSHFIANMSHEIRTPLNVIIGMTQILLNGEMMAKNKDKIEKIQKAGHHLLEVINNILDFSKLEAGKLSIKKESFSIGECFSEIESIFSSKVDQKNISIQFNVDKKIPEKMIGDSLRIKQIIMNFLGNAIKFTEKGYIHVEASFLEMIENDILLKFSVNDSGIGISEDEMYIIFNNFQQADPSITRKYGGSGLGLSISKELAELMGGTVGVESVKGVGSKFWLKMKLEIDSSFVQTVPRERANLLSLNPLKNGLKGKNILLAEDNELNQEVIVGFLDQFDVEIDVVSNGKMAVDKILSPIFHRKYDVVLMDIQMPVMDGLEAVKIIRNTVPADQLPIVAITANASQQDKDLCLSVGFSDFLTKPIRQENLIDCLLKWVSSGISKNDFDLNLEEKSMNDRIKRMIFEINVPDLSVRDGLSYFNNNGDSYLNILSKFSSTQCVTPILIEKALLSNHVEEAQRLAHTLKGLCGMIGSHRSFDLSKEVELSIKNGAPSYSALANLKQAIADLTDGIKEEISKIKAEINSQTEENPVKLEMSNEDVIKNLISLLNDNEAKAIFYFKNNEKIIRKIMTNKFDSLEDSIMNYNYELALKMLVE